MTHTSTFESARLIKARGTQAASLLLNFDDRARQRDEAASQIQEQKNLIIAEALHEADEIRRAAYAEGLAAGRQEALANSSAFVAAQADEMARAEIATRLAGILPALETVIDRLAADRDRWTASWEASAVTLACAVAEKIIHRELAQRPELRVSLVGEALQLAAGQTRVRIRVSAGDAPLMKQAAQNSLLKQPGVASFEIFVDDSIDSGGCIVETQHGVIDARLDSQLQRIIDELVEAPA